MDVIRDEHSSSNPPDLSEITPDPVTDPPDASDSEDLSEITSAPIPEPTPLGEASSASSSTANLAWQDCASHASLPGSEAAPQPESGTEAEPGSGQNPAEGLYDLGYLTEGVASYIASLRERVSRTQADLLTVPAQELRSTLQVSLLKLAQRIWSLGPRPWNISHHCATTHHVRQYLSVYTVRFLPRHRTCGWRITFTVFVYRENHHSENSVKPQRTASLL